MMRLLLVFAGAASCLLPSSAFAGRCDSPAHAEVSRLRALAASANEDLTRDPAPTLARVRAEAKALAARAPADWEAQLELLRVEDTPPDRVDRRDALKAAAQAPNASALSAYLYASSLSRYQLLGGEAMTWYRTALERDPSLLPAQLGLASAALLAEKIDDAVRAADAWFGACADSTAGLEILPALPPQAQTRWMKELRARLLPTLAPDELATAHLTLWRAAFKTTPPARHAALRAEIGAELDRLAPPNAPPSAQPGYPRLARSSPPPSSRATTSASPC